jgi:hypothetical protein
MEGNIHNMTKGERLTMEPYFVVNWEPLRNVLEKDECKHFMFMASYVNSQGREIFTYKHIVTRMYINVDREGRFYQYTGNDYCEIPSESALKRFSDEGVILNTV